MRKAEHLFISYASEDSVFADWLARKLACEGYLVWFDRLKLLGGESYPKDIDNAIKTLTFRLIAILSRNSILKSKPIKERTLALNIGQERDFDFLIPVNLDGLEATELDWMSSDLTFIPFQNNWQSGLSKLLKKLQSINTPKTQLNGLQLAARSYEITQPSQKSECLISNVMPCREIPAILYLHKLGVSLRNPKNNDLDNNWAFYIVNDKCVLSFQPPPVDLELANNIHSESHSISQPEISGINTANIVSRLLYKSVWNEFLRLGCKPTPDGDYLYFPNTVFPDNRIKFENYNGRLSRVSVSGKRTFMSGGQRTSYYYHLCPFFRIRRDLHYPFCLQLNPRIFFTDINGMPLPPRSASSRRKKITRWWFNHQWASRTLAIQYFLMNGKEQVIIDNRMNGQSIVFEKVMRCSVPVGIEEDKPELPDEIIDVSDQDIIDGEND